MNKIILSGNLTKDPEQIKDNIISFTLAVNRTTKDGEKQADFFKITTFNKVAEACAKYLKKGAHATVCGVLQTNEYKDKDGNTKVSYDVIANEVDFN